MYRFVLTIALIAASLAGADEGAQSTASAPQYLAGTSHIAGILANLGAATDDAHVLIPAGMCPGHFDLRPSDVGRVAEADAVIIHDWQSKMPNVQGALKAADKSVEDAHIVAVAGNWMAPPVQAEAVETVADIVALIEPRRTDAVRRRAKARVRDIQAHGDAVKKRFEQADASASPVLAHFQQAAFLEWAGYPVVATFGHGEMSAADAARLGKRGREEEVVLVVDNLQSGDPRLAGILAEETGAQTVVLNNFPGGAPGTGTWEKALESNYVVLTEALEGQDAP
jgi:zinc transport system substrate-binding protein